MIADGDGLPRYVRVASAVRRQIADGTLRPGQQAPSGAALSRATGYSALTCRRALRVLIAEGALMPGASPNARPRVAGVQLPPVQRVHDAAARALSAGLASRRRAAGLTQPDLAALAGVSVTTVGHAETGRLWQSRGFWERADTVLGAGGDMLRLHDAYQSANLSRGYPAVEGWPLAGTDDQSACLPARPAPEAPEAVPGHDDEPARPCGPAGSGVPAPSHVMVVWDDGTVTLVHPPGSGGRRPAVST